MLSQYKWLILLNFLPARVILNDQDILSFPYFGYYSFLESFGKNIQTLSTNVNPYPSGFHFQCGMVIVNSLKPTYSITWNKKVHDADSLCSVFTVSDEAFALLVLENNWERWLDINNKSKNNYIPTKRNRGDKPVESDILPLYTNINGNSANAGKEVNRGWTEAGIKRLNELCTMVKEDRKKMQLLIGKSYLK